MTGTENTRLTPLEVCTLIAHEAVSMLDTVQTELPSCMKDFRAALEALHTIHDLGKDGETLLAWVDTEVANAERFIADGTNLPYLIDMCCLDIAPDAVTQVGLIWTLFDTAAMEQCSPDQQRALLNTARTVTEMCDLDGLLLATLKPNAAKLADGLRTELDDVRESLRIENIHVGHCDGAGCSVKCGEFPKEDLTQRGVISKEKEEGDHDAADEAAGERA